MSKYLLVIATLLTLGAMHASAQRITMNCIRDVDGKPLIPDSVGVSIGAGGKMVVAAGATVDLSNPTSVAADRSGTATPVVYEAFDIQGRWVGERTAAADCVRLMFDRDYGVTLLVPRNAIVVTGDYARKGKIFAGEVAQITVWKRGYVTAEFEYMVDGSEETVDCTMLLAPWQMRFKCVKVSGFIPVIKCTTFDGTIEYVSYPAMNMSAEIGCETPIQWEVVDSYILVPGAKGPTVGFQATAPPGIIDFHVVEKPKADGSGASKYVDFRVGRWDTVATDRMVVDMVDSKADEMLLDVKIYNSGNPTRQLCCYERGTKGITLHCEVMLYE